MTGFLVVILATALFHVCVLLAIAVKLIPAIRGSKKIVQAEASPPRQQILATFREQDFRKLCLWGVVAILSAITVLNEIVCLIVLKMLKPW
jgi:hypothetical protein